MAGRQNQIFCAFALVGSDHAQVRQHALVDVHHHARHQPLRQGQDQRARLRNIGNGRDVGGCVIGRQDALFLFLGDKRHQLAIRGLEYLVLGVLPFDHAGGGDTPHVRLRCAHEIHFVQQMGHGFFGGIAAVELQLSDRRIHGFHFSRQGLCGHGKERSAEKRCQECFAGLHI
ncbi:hypothetical protein D3C72_1519180 [compost metagenome]